MQFKAENRKKLEQVEFEEELGRIQAKDTFAFNYKFLIHVFQNTRLNWHLCKPKLEINSVQRKVGKKNTLAVM